MVPDRLGHYRVLQKLGAGGMGEVYLAEDTKLGRKVALKLLPERMASNPDRLARFQREAQTVAALNHPNIVTLYSVEEADGRPFLTMELIDGQPLTARLRREGLSLEEVLSLALPLIDAVDAAHQGGVTHRDLKPDNVMITTRGAVKVLDFGLAKLAEVGLASSVASETAVDVQTQEGRILGTVSYMSPEQAEGRSVDHRSDIFSLGILLYEMASGLLPFRGDSNLSILSSILRDTPRPVGELRRDLPAELGRIVQRCLEKDPDRRYQSARDLYNDLSSLRGRERPSVQRPWKSGVLRVLILYCAVSAVLLWILRTIVRSLGLPDWVLPGAIVLLVLGLPILTATALAQRKARARSRRWFTWRKAIGGGVLAFAFWGLLVTAYVVSRELGIGPAASLVSSGALAAQDRVLVADFENQTADEALGSAVKEALTIDLAQSNTVQVVAMERVGEVLRLMERDPNSPLDLTLARELAERDGIKAVVAGQIHPAGNGYVLSARVISATSGDVLGAYRSTADSPDEIIHAIDHLSEEMREDIGESLKSIRGDAPLDHVTTQSLEALRKYSLAVRKNDLEGDTERAVALLEEATRIDSTFAMAHRKLGIILTNTFQRRATALEALGRAYRHRDRLPPRERFLAEASYYLRVTAELDKAVAAYERLLEMDPRDGWALNNIGVVLSSRGETRRALEYFQQAFAAGRSALNLSNIISAQSTLGEYAAAESSLAEFERIYPENPEALGDRAVLAASRFDYPLAEEKILAYRKAVEGRSPLLEARGDWGLGSLRAVQGRLREAEARWNDAASGFERAGNPTARLESALDLAILDAFVRQRPDLASRRLDRAIKETPLESLPVGDRPYLRLASIYALVGRLPDAHAMVSRHDREAEVDLAMRKLEESERRLPMGVIALAENRPGNAIVELRAYAQEEPSNPLRALPLLGQAYASAGMPDSALAVHERYLTTRLHERIVTDQQFLGMTLFRVAELYEARGDRERAVHYYQRFVDLWAEADPDLLDRVDRAKRSIAALMGERQISLNPAVPTTGSN